MSAGIALLGFELLALGLVTGFLAGLLGIGGGILLVPALTFFVTQRGAAPEQAVKMAIATSMATILFTSLSSLVAHHKRGRVRWDLVRGLAPGIVLGGLLAGAGAFASLNGALLALLFAAFIVFSATRMLRERGETTGRHAMPGVLGQWAIGAAVGFLSGLVGAGGAFATVPVMTWCSVPIHNAMATSAALGFPIALASTVGYLIGGRGLVPALPGAYGYFYLPALLVVASASVVAAPLGATVASRLETRQLRRAFAVLLFGLAGYMIAHAWRG